MKLFWPSVTIFGGILWVCTIILLFSGKPSENSINSIEKSGKMKKVCYMGHSYIVWEIKGSGGCGCVHDPDCLCQHRSVH